MRALLTLLAVVLMSCAPAAAPGATSGESSPLPPPPANPHQLSAAQCQEAGGAMRPVCMMGAVQCVITYADAGRACRDGDDCQGDCRADEMGPSGASATGRCQANSDPCGCFANVEDGRIDAAMCVD